MDKNVSVLKGILEGLQSPLMHEFLAGRIHGEADVQCYVAGYLKEQLRCAVGWIVGCEHPLCPYKPDILCSHLPSLDKLGKMIETRAAFAVGVVEIKYGAPLRDDLEKLSQMQKKMKGTKTPIAWMIYGDHFNETVHAANCKKQLGREQEIKNWKEEKPDYRGYTILKVGVAGANDSAEDRAVRDAFNQHFWLRDS